MDIVILILSGATVGFLSSFFGIGGGSLIVPTLYTLFPSLPPSAVISISLGTIFINSSINTIRFIKLKLTPSKIVFITFLITCTLGAFSGSQVVGLIDKPMAKKVIAILLFVIVAKLFLSKKKKDNQEEYKDNPVKLGITGISGSILSSLTGLGGGIIFTPMFLSVVKLPLKRVSAYSNLAMLVANLIGVIPHLFVPLNYSELKLGSFFTQSFVGSVNIAMILILSASAFFTAKIGIRYNESVSHQTKKYLLASLIFLLALKMIL